MRLRLYGLFVMFFCAVISVLCGCASMKPFTGSLIQEYDLKPDEIKRLQFYVSSGLLFERESMTIGKDVNIQNHSLKKVEDKYIKQIYFKRRTPCIAFAVSGSRMNIAFEADDQLLFSIAKDDDPVKDIFYYVPDKKVWPPEKGVRSSDAGYKMWKKAGTEKYVDSTYNVFIRRNHYPFLLVDEKSLKNLVIEKRRVKGMRQAEYY